MNQKWTFKLAFSVAVILGVCLSVSSQTMETDEGLLTFIMSKEEGRLTYNPIKYTVKSYTRYFTDITREINYQKLQLIPDHMLQKMVPSCFSDLDISQTETSQNQAGEKDNTSSRGLNGLLGVIVR